SEMLACSSLVAVATRFERIVDSKLGNAIAARIATMATVTISSISVKPLLRTARSPCPHGPPGSLARSLATASPAGRAVGIGGWAWSPPSGHHLITRPIIPTDLHPALLHERPQQRIQRLHHVLVAMDLERPVRLDPAHAVLLHVPRNDA